MVRKPSGLLALVFLCGVGQAGEPAAYGPPFVARLPQGTVELVGVTNDYRPTRQSQWWRPDGSVAPIGPFRAVQDYGDTTLRANEKVRTFLVRFKDLPAEASIDPAGGVNSSTAALTGRRNFVAGKGRTARNPAQSFTGAPSWDAGSHLWIATAVYYAERVATRYNPGPSPPAAADAAGTYTHYKKAPHYYRMFAAVLAESARTTDLRVGVSMGEWETVTSWKPHSAGRSSFSRDGGKWTVTYNKATTVDNTTQVFLKSSSYTYGQWNRRVVAVTSDGSEHASSIQGAHSGLDGNEGTAVFGDLRLYSIEELRLQVRPYHGVEFHNISLRPGQKTQVRVVSFDDSGKTKR